MTDKNSDLILDFCINNKIDHYIGSPKKDESFLFYQNKKIDVLISINYLFLIDKSLINLPQKIAFNIHGSLLPKYRGRTPHVWAIINDEFETGITAHLIDEGCDTGEIIDQVIVPIDVNDTGFTILEKYKDLYFPLIEKILDSIENNKLNTIPQDNSKGCYFPKRTPLDGKINWNWQKKQIYNWVRAQSNPYPGAHTFINNQKLIIDKIIFTEHYYNNELPNGLIINDSPFLVKTPNGVVEIIEYRRTDKISIYKNNILE
jgi:methionyl-tRNA formyltransferase